MPVANEDLWHSSATGQPEQFHEAILHRVNKDLVDLHALGPQQVFGPRAIGTHYRAVHTNVDHMETLMPSGRQYINQPQDGVGYRLQFLAHDTANRVGTGKHGLDYWLIND